MAALQPLAEQAHAAAVVPQNLSQRGEIIRPFDQNPGCLIVMMSFLYFRAGAPTISRTPILTALLSRAATEGQELSCRQHAFTDELLN